MQPAGRASRRLAAVPHALTPLVGRERDVGAAQRLLRAGYRLLTLIGPAGVGKTRLALAIAEATAELFPDGAVFVSLAPIGDPELVRRLVAAAFAVTDANGVDILSALMEQIGAHEVLLVLDNFEHVLTAAPLLSDLLAACPGLRVLTTSRSPLKLTGEYLQPVPTLSLPERGREARLEEVARSEAIQLFLDRARAACGEFTLTAQNASGVIDICRKLDGLPLAIELAAARLRVLPPAALLDRLERGLPVLSGGARDRPARMRTMRDAVAWSYALLTVPQQALFRRLGVFAGGWTVEDVERVCMADIQDFDALEGLSALLDHSLIRRSAAASAEPRFDMLHVVREFAMDQLVAAGEELAARQGHARYFRDLAGRAGAARASDQERLYGRITDELNNIRAILAWSLSGAATAADLTMALELTGELWFYWIHHGGAPGEARLWLTRALQAAPQQPSAPRAKALVALGAIEWRQGDYALARQHLDASVAFFSEGEDFRGLADALHLAGHVRFEAREFAEANELYAQSEAAFARVGDLLGTLPLIGDLGMVAYHQGDYASARDLFERCLRSCREQGVTDHAADSLNRLGDLARLAADLLRAEALYTESLTLWRTVHGRPGIASALHKLGQTARRRGDHAEAHRLVAESLELQTEWGNKQGMVECLAALAGLALEGALPERAVELLAASEAALESLRVPLSPADAMDFERDRLRGKASLSPQAWTAADRRGRAMSIAEALSLARAATPGASTRSPTDVAGAQTSRLSPREKEVAALIARGMSNREIAGALTISEKTAANHVEHIMTKLDLRSRAQVAVWAVSAR